MMLFVLISLQLKNYSITFNSCNVIPIHYKKICDAIVPKSNYVKLVAAASFSLQITSLINWSVAIEIFPSKYLTKIAIS